MRTIGISLPGRMRKWIVLSILPLASACSPHALSNRAIEYNEVAAQAADTQLLLNVVRAAYRNPTRYSSISQLRDLRSAEGGGMLSAQLPFGADALRIFPFSPSISGRFSQTPSYDVIPLDTKAAALGLYRPVEAQTFVTYWQQGWPKNVLLSLFVDTVTMNAAARAMCGLPGDFARVDNAAYSPGAFQKAQLVFNCLRKTLEIIEKTDTDTPISNAALPPEEVINALPSLAAHGFRVQQAGTAGARTYSITKKVKAWTPVLVQHKVRRGEVELSANSATVPVSGSVDAKVGLTFRSVDGMVYFLGEMVRSQVVYQKPLPQIVYGREDGPAGGFAYLFRVDVNANAHPDRVIEVPFLDGQYYSLSRLPPESDVSLTTLSLISQLFSQYREGSDLPRTSATQLVGGGPL